MSDRRTTAAADLEPINLRDLVAELTDGDMSREVSSVTFPTGFQPLDSITGGGLTPGEMTLVGGTPGIGKTIATLQWARNIALDGTPVVYVCYEHDEADLLARLMSIELGELSEVDTDVTEKLRLQIRQAALGGGGLADLLAADPLTRRAYTNLRRYAPNLEIMKASGRHTGIPEIERIIDELAGEGVLFVDYLQKVATSREFPNEAEKVTVVTEDLKQLALDRLIPIVSVVAADLAGLRSPRLRLHHFRGSSALAFEADVAIILNDKYSAVSKVHRDYDPLTAAEYKNWAIFSIEKNRSGPPGISLEFRKDFEHFRFQPVGGVVTEKLVDEQLHVE